MKKILFISAFICFSSPAQAADKGDKKGTIPINFTNYFGSYHA